MTQKIIKRTNKKISLFLALVFCILSFSSAINVETKAVKISENSDISLKVAEEGIVLLKNEASCLPFTPDMKIGVYGKYDNEEYVAGGGGSGWVNTNYVISPYTGLKYAASKNQIASVKKMTSTSDDKFDRVVYFITRASTEGEDRKAEAGDYYLSDEEKSDIKELLKTYKGKLTVVLNIAGVIDTTWLIESGVSAIVLMWLAGGNGGYAVSNVLTGVVSPSGKLVDTWASDIKDYLSTENFFDHTNVYYREDIFVGYRQFETFDPEYKKVNFEFGFGLSYTDFEIKTNDVTFEDGNATVDVTVTNIGSKYSGKEVVQVYYSAPDEILGNPGKELAAFAKTKCLAPGESENLSISFNVNDMASYDDTGKIKKSSWVLEKGNYNIYVGNSIKNAGKNGVVKTYTVPENIIVEECFEYGTIIDKRLTSSGVYEEFAKENSGNSEKIHVVNPYGSTYISAVDYSDITDQARVEYHYHGVIPHATLGYLSNPGSYVSYSLKVENEGEYYLSFSLANNVDRDSFGDIYINGEKQNIKYSVKGNGWTSFSLSDAKKIKLPKGDVELKIAGNAITNVSHMYISNNVISPDGKTVIEAETAQMQKEKSACVSDGVLDMYEANSKKLYNIYAEKAGDYFLSLNYSNVEKAVLDAIEISVNGETLVEKFDLSRTGYSTKSADEDNLLEYKESHGIKITLNEGRNTVILNSTENAESIGYIDSLFFDVKDNGVEFEDNTEKYEGLSTDGKILPTKIYFSDLFISFADADKENDLLDEFVSQLSISDMARMAGIYNELDNSGTGTGGFGSPDAPMATGKFGLNAASTADGPAGIRSTDGDAFTFMPCVSLLASSWNVSLAYDFGKAIGKEAALKGVEVWLAPGANIHRNLLCGRNFEYISEDPYVTGKIAANIINGCQSQGVGCSMKHFAANNKEDNRNGSLSIVSERALREIYLKGFEIAVKQSAPVTIMTSYNLINGVETACDYNLLIEIARKEWGFEGLFISDWGNNINHPISINAGHNIMSDNPDADAVVKAYCGGKITRAQLEENTKYILKAMLRLTDGCIKIHSITASTSKFNACEYTAALGKIYDSNQEIRITENNDLYYSIVVEEDADYYMAFDISAKEEFGFDVYVDGERYISAHNKTASGEKVYSFGEDAPLKLSAGMHTILISGTTGDIKMGDITVSTDKNISFDEALTDGGFELTKDSIYASVIKPKENDESEDSESSDVSDESFISEEESKVSSNTSENTGDNEKKTSGFYLYVIAGVVIVAVAVFFVVKKRK